MTVVVTEEIVEDICVFDEVDPVEDIEVTKEVGVVEEVDVEIVLAAVPPPPPPLLSRMWSLPLCRLPPCQSLRHCMCRCLCCSIPKVS
jgi:hypothetical protein